MNTTTRRATLGAALAALAGCKRRALDDVLELIDKTPQIAVSYRKNSPYVLRTALAAEWWHAPWFKQTDEGYAVVKGVILNESANPLRLAHIYTQERHPSVYEKGMLLLPDFNGDGMIGGNFVIFG